MIVMRVQNFFLALMLLCIVLRASGLPDDNKKPLSIIADSATMNNKTGISVYMGHVKATQGSMELTGQMVTVYSQEKKILKVMAEGSAKEPAYYQEEQEKNKGQLKAWGNKITYDTKKETVSLLHNAKIIRPGQEFTGDYVEYNKMNQTVNAKSEKGHTHRVQIVIQPSTGKVSSSVSMKPKTSTSTTKQVETESKVSNVLSQPKKHM